MNSLSDFIEFYPSPDDPELQQKVSNKREFFELASDKSEERLLEPDDSDEAYYLYKHQRLFSRLSRFLHRALIIDRPGTGKTCKVLGAMNWYKENDSMITKFIVLVPNEAILSDVRNQIICKCTGGKYYIDKIKNSTSERGRESIITRFLKKHFLIETREKFIRGIIKKYPDYETMKSMPSNQDVDDGMLRDIALLNEQKLKQDYSGSFIYLDEAHLMSDKLAASEFETNGDDGENIYEAEQRESPGRKKGKKKKKLDKDTIIRSKKEYYKQYHRMFHLIERSIIVLTTATPLINETKDIIPLINLLAPLDQQLSENIKLENESLDYISENFGNYIHYIRPRDNNVDISMEGEQLTWNGINLISEVSEMKEEQKQIYYQAYQADQGKRDEKGVGSSDNAIQASSFTFPNGDWGDHGVSKYFKKITDPRTSKQIVRNPDTGFIDYNQEFYNAFKGKSDEETISKIEKYSCKCAKILRLIQQSNNVVYITVANINSEALVYAWCLQLLGYPLYTRKDSAFESVERTLGDYCISANPEDNKITKSFDATRNTEKKPYFALYAGNLMKREIIRSSRELVSSPHNYDGHYIKVFIGSPKVKLGININNVDQIHNTRSDWNEGGNLQRESRAIRDTSHTTIIKKLQEEQEDQGVYEEVRFEVKLYRHSAIATESKGSYSSDLDRYARSIEKEMPIQKVMRMLMITAVDCNLNKNRNTLPNKYDYTIDCNYQACDYQCYQKADNTDDSTYDVYYLKHKLRQIIFSVYPLLRDNGSIRYQQLFELLSDIPKQQIIAAINELIANKISVKDKYGNYAYVYEAKDIVYLINEYSDLRIKSLDRAYYNSSNMINTFSRSNDSIFNDFISDIYYAFLEQMIDSDYQTIVENLPLQSIDLQVKILEQSVINDYQNNKSNFDESVLSYYQSYIYDVHEPVVMITAAENLARFKDPRGRKATLEKKEYRIVSDEIEFSHDETDTEMVTFHILYIQDYLEGKKRHGETERYLNAQGRYRLYKPSEGYWRDLSIYEYKAYSRIVSNQRKTLVEEIKKEHPISGKISNNTDKGFRIVDVRKEMKEGQQVTKGSAKSKGFVCIEHQPIIKLFFYAWWFQIDLNVFYNHPEYKTDPKKHYYDAEDDETFIIRMDLKDDNGYKRELKDIPEDELNYYLELKRIFTAYKDGGSKLGKKHLCQAIKEEMAAVGALFDINGNIVYETKEY